jgi:hypothetical protein
VVGPLLGRRGIFVRSSHYQAVTSEDKLKRLGLCSSNFVECSLYMQVNHSANPIVSPNSVCSHQRDGVLQFSTWQTWQHNPWVEIGCHPNSTYYEHGNEVWVP